MTVSLATLQALQRQAGAGRRAPASASPIAPARTRHGAVDIAALRRLLRVRATRIPTPVARTEARTLPGTEIAPGLQLIEASLPAPPLPVRIGGAFDRRGDFDAGRALFFDTETTGLAGGTGTRAFMLGVACWQGDAFHVRQLLITTLAAESAMLAAFARWLHPDAILVSYNGKSYDLPLLRARYRLARLPDPTAGREHIDLLYPARRRYRGVFEDCRLATIERRVLGIVREDDLPGSEAPAAWLGWLRGQSAANLRRVLAHNQQDVVSLARLLRHLDD